ncbi:MAG: hypothetical protein LBJ25_04665 [Candidatus Margulisbacteria bacterium]|nr:hypothetical protein [Candidatus Margulisiibacteriota bacterium]
MSKGENKERFFLRKRLKIAVIFFLLICVFGFSREYTLEEKLTQLFMLGFQGSSPREFADFVSGNNWGGYIFYTQDENGNPINFSTEEQAVKLLEAVRGNSGETKLKPFLAVDLEGGQLQLYKNESTDFTYFQSPQTVAAADKAGRELWAKNIGVYLQRLGFNLNLAPVVDVDRPPFANSRSFGGTAEIVIENGRLFLDAHQDNGVLCALKHFPGRGSGRPDDINNLYDKTVDLRPFQELLRHDNAALVMVSTLVYPQIDTEKPAYKSRAVYELLRSLGYDNIALTDAVSVRGRSVEELQAEMLEIIEAGADLILITNKDSDYDPLLSSKLRQVVENIVRKKLLSEERIEKSFARILRIKQEHGVEPREIYLNYEI